ncbi:hypothetical protein K4A83_21030, partial [Spirulina subsalsa FACHB-351]
GTNSLISSNATGTGNAGNIDLFSPQLSLQGNAQVSVSNTGTGNAGNLGISASEIKLTNSTLKAETIRGSGGNITLQNLQNLNLNNSQISASTIDGQSGNITATPRQQTTLNNNSRILAQATGTGNAGNIQLQTGDLTIQNNSEISIRTDGTGNSGNLDIQARSIFLNNQGKINASTAAGNGGNINLTVAQSIILRFNSDITAEAGGFGTGGNITFNVGGFILAFLPENSDIVASAFQGRGGNITGRARGIFGFRQFQGRRTPESDFTATSELGIDGIVNIDILDKLSLDNLPQEFITAELATGCAAIESENPIALYNIGSGGFPNSPTAPLTSTNIWQDLNLPHPPLIEAQTWRTNAQGDIELVAQIAPGHLLVPCRPEP